MITRIALKPFERGRSVTKSMDKCDQGNCGIGSGWRRPKTPWGLGLCTDMAGLNIFRPPEGVL